MFHRFQFKAAFLAFALALHLAGGCSDDSNPTAPRPYDPLTTALELTPNLDSGSPVAISAEGSQLAVVYTSTIGGSGDIYRLVLQDSDDDGLYDTFPLGDHYPNENDSTQNYDVPFLEQFSFIGAYEYDVEGSDGQDSTVITYPGTVYLSGPRHLFYEPSLDRIFYSMGYAGISQIASTQAPADGVGGHVHDIVNEADPALEGASGTSGREPIWDFWYTKTDIALESEPSDWAFTGGFHASVSLPVEGVRWLVYADTLNLSLDRDGDGRAGEDPVGAIEVLAGGNDDGEPGYAGVDDDFDEFADGDDPEVAAMLEAAPVEGSFAWRLQNYVPALDDDEDGFIDEDVSEQIDNDDDDLINEDARELPTDNDIDGSFDEDPAETFIDNDADGRFDEDPSEQVDNDTDGVTGEDPWEIRIDDDGDGSFDEDAAELAIDNDGDGVFDEDPSEQVDNDADGEFSEDRFADGIDEDQDGLDGEDPIENEIDNDLDGLLDEDPSEQIDDDNDGLFGEDAFLDIDDDSDGRLGEDPVDGIDNDDDGATDEDPVTGQIDNDGDGRYGEDPVETEVDDDADEDFSEDPSEQIDNDGDGLFGEDGLEQIDNDGDGLLNEDGIDSQIDNDGDGLIDEDPAGDANGDGAPGLLGVDDDLDDLIDGLDIEVGYGLLRAERKNDYDYSRDDDEDGISDEDANLGLNGIWIRKIREDGLPDNEAVPINLTNDGGRQPFFNPVGALGGNLGLLYVKAGDIHELTLACTPDTMEIADQRNLTQSGSLEAYPAYSDDGQWIVYSSSVGGSADIWIMSADGAERRQVTNDPGQELYPRFTPAGNQILFEAWLFPSGARRVMLTTEPLPGLP